MEADQLVVSIAGAAEIIGISREAVWQAIRKGRLDGFRIGREWLISRAAVNGYRLKRTQRLKRYGALRRNAEIARRAGRRSADASLGITATPPGGESHASGRRSYVGPD